MASSDLGNAYGMWASPPGHGYSSNRRVGRGINHFGYLRHPVVDRIDLSLRLGHPQGPRC